MKIDYSKYILTPKKSLNNFSKQSPREGMLLRFDNNYYVDYHPWKEFGDISCDELIGELREDIVRPYITELLSLEIDKDKITYEPFLNQGIQNKIIKVKVYLQHKELCDYIESLDEDNFYRFDFNNRDSIEDILELWNKLSKQAKDKIQYFEDPCSNETECWQELVKAGIPLACDRNVKESKFYNFEVFKPNCESFTQNDRPQVFSSYMGHDLGRFHTYLSLCRFGDLSLVHGIDTPDIYHEQNNLFMTKGNLTTINKSVLSSTYESFKDLLWTKI